MFVPPSVGNTVEIAELESLTKGHIIAGDGSGAPTTLAPGSNNDFIVYDSAQTTGLKSQTPAQVRTILGLVAAGAGDIWVEKAGDTMTGDLLIYQAVNDANPEVRIGAVDAEELHVQAVYDSGAQTLDYVLFQTDAASATANKGQYRFNVDGTDILDINDAGILLKDGMGISLQEAITFTSTVAGENQIVIPDNIDGDALAIKDSGGGGTLMRFKTANGFEEITLYSNSKIDSGATFIIGGSVGFFNTAAQTKQEVTGAHGSNAALQSLLAALATYGLITNSSS